MRRVSLPPSFDAAPRSGGSSDAPGRKTMRKVRWRLLPLLFLLDVVAVMDRTNIGLAALQMNRDLGLSATAFGVGAGIFFLAYPLFEVPSNLMLVRVGARRWIARIAITWGIIASLMLFVAGPISLFLLRFTLGVAEAGFFPGIIYYLSLWFPERERARAISRFMIAIPMSSAIGGPIGGALLGLRGRFGLAGWQWLFLVEGVAAIILGIAALVYLTDSPEQAEWLAPEERAWLSARLDEDRSRDGHAGGSGDVRGALSSELVWSLSIVYLLALSAGYAITFWTPVIIRGLLRASDQRVGLLVGLIGISAVAPMLVNAWRSDRQEERTGHAAAGLLLAACGLIAAATVKQPTVAILALAVTVIGVNAFLPAFWCLTSAVGGGAVGIALVSSVGNVGGFIGPSALGAVKSGTGSFTGGLLGLAVLILGAAGMTLGLRRWAP